MLRTSIVIDYQNVHLTAHDVFEPRGELHDALVHPMQFARRAIEERNSRVRDGFALAKISRVLVFRGRPHVDHDSAQHRRCNDQAAQWQADGALVELRDLKYKYKTINGTQVPDGRPREKGIDVLCALACVRETTRPDIDLVILASRDTDLVPALDELYDFRGTDSQRYAMVETVAWFNSRWRDEATMSGGSLKPTEPRRIWNTNLNRECFESSLDPNDYR